MVGVFVIPLGLEPKTHSLEGCCSIQLSYGTILIFEIGCKGNCFFADFQNFYGFLSRFYFVVMVSGMVRHHTDGLTIYISQ